jgi:CO dehydrogenase maturation factor
MIVLFAGTGGVGKSTLAAGFVEAAVLAGVRPLVIDSDPDQALCYMLDLDYPERTIADALDADYSASTLRQEGLTAGELFTQKADSAIVSTDVFDFVAMGATKGGGCYCAANNALRTYLASIHNQYPLIIIDSPGGKEHISRDRLKEVDLFVLVTRRDPISYQRATSLLEKAREMELGIKSLLWVNNNSPVVPFDDCTLRVDGYKPSMEMEIGTSKMLIENSAGGVTAVRKAWGADHRIVETLGEIVNDLMQQNQ